MSQCCMNNQNKKKKNPKQYRIWEWAGEARTTIISVLVKADKHANDFQMFFSILQESCETGGGTEGSKLEQRKQTFNMPAPNHK